MRKRLSLCLYYDVLISYEDLKYNGGDLDELPQNSISALELSLDLGSYGQSCEEHSCLFFFFSS